jgi:hypothetical protein
VRDDYIGAVEWYIMTFNLIQVMIIMMMIVMMITIVRIIIYYNDDTA